MNLKYIIKQQILVNFSDDNYRISIIIGDYKHFNTKTTFYKRTNQNLTKKIISPWIYCTDLCMAVD